MAIDTVRAAYEALGEGDVEPLVSLIHPDMEWRGRRRPGRFFQPPSWRGPNEAREALAAGISHRKLLGDRDYTLDFVQSRRDRVVVAYSWSSKDGQRHKWAQALRLKHGKIIDMEDFANPRSAAALMRLRAALA